MGWEVRPSLPLRSVERTQGLISLPSRSNRADLFHALRWSIGLAVIASGYAIAVRTGYIDDVVGQASAKLTETFLVNR